jgi:hypothetical protein
MLSFCSTTASSLVPRFRDALIRLSKRQRIQETSVARSAIFSTDAKTPQGYTSLWDIVEGFLPRLVIMLLPKRYCVILHPIEYDISELARPLIVDRGECHYSPFTAGPRGQLPLAVPTIQSSHRGFL